MINLNGLSLVNSNFNGSLPDSIGKLNMLNNLIISNNNFNNIPISISNLQYLEQIAISNNENIDSLPINMFNSNLNLNSILIWANNCGLKNFPILPPGWYNAINIANNRLTFEDIEPLLTENHHYFDFTYSPQDSVLEHIDTVFLTGDSFELNSLVGGQNNIYTWKKASQIISSSTNPILEIHNANASHSGNYTCEISNSIATSLVLNRRFINVLIDTSTLTSHMGLDNKFEIIYITETNSIFIDGKEDNSQLIVSDIIGNIIFYNKNIKFPVTIQLPKRNKYILKIVTNTTILTKKIF